MNDKKNLMFEELESVEELGAFYDFLDGVGKGLPSAPVSSLSSQL